MKNQNIVNLFKRLKRLCNISVDRRSKDPQDYTKCDLSTVWLIDDIYCQKCMKSTGHNEFMSGFCNRCGSFNTQTQFGRSYRKIKIDGKWKYQIRYRNGGEEVRDKWY